MIDRDDESAGGDLGNVARKVSGWTSNLIVTAIVLIIAVVGGRQLVSWWRPPTSGSRAEVAPPLAPVDTSNVNESLTLEFGDHPIAIQRAVVTGELDDALLQMRKECRRVLQLGASATLEPAQTQTPSEKKLLASLSKQTPVESQPEAWRIFETRTLMPLVLGIKDEPRDEQRDEQRSETGDEQSVSRLVVWGMAIPDGPEQWKTFVCIPNRAGIATSSPHDFTAPIPPDCQRTLSISTAAGEQMVGFQGGRCDQLAKFFDLWASENDFVQHSAWTITGNSWRATFERDASPRIRMKVQLFHVDLSSADMSSAELPATGFVADPGGRSTANGLLTIQKLSPPSAAASTP